MDFTKEVQKMDVCMWGGGVLRQVDMIARQLADFDYIG